MTITPHTSPLTAAVNARRWRLAMAAVCSVVGGASSLFLHGFTKLNVHGADKLHEAILARPKGTPLITVSNHASTLDDPIIWGALPFSIFNTRVNKLRWTLGAQEICYKNGPLSYFFTAGKTVPIVRGHGVYQPAMDFATERLGKGDWVHIFPEGKVHQEDTMLPFRWGVGRLILDSTRPPLLLPIYHRGLARIHPLKGGPAAGWLPRPFLPLDISVGDPIDTSAWRDQHFVSARDHRQWVTAQVEHAMESLQTRSLGHAPLHTTRGSEPAPK
ncbi:hypothetical protein AMAG_03017 [Allomyces macrogynus ATCC 38327]|uniref:Tafazzin family protein n=1 Tax=Allomyces macrogynus (strain ATCC 38327) TaxID=578462 RepID=A0A0L0S4B2_ALLM3|nr:hypothetical protein AMAG_03017 [Allomyces macrogynus ATCC 38327]|eukprot:KNE57285.1 hypothetical protein AMAG_03017 [Allomyces macrogynus ATCC 38327]